MSADGSPAPRASYTTAHELAHELTSPQAHAVTYRDGDELVERMLVEPHDYVADLLDAMLDTARRKIERDQPPADELNAVVDLLSALDRRSRLRRATAATHLAAAH